MENNWEKEFDEQFEKGYFDNKLNGRANSQRTKFYIRDLLAQAESRMRTELKEKAEKLRRGPTLCGNCNLNGPLCEECYANRRANKMLDDFLALLSRTEE